MNRGARALFFPALVAALTFSFLIHLGLWQLRRLEEKEALISRVQTRVSLPAQELPAKEEWKNISPADYEYRHVRITGRFRQSSEAFIYSRAPEGLGREPGYFVLTPFDLASGGVILIDRGFISNQDRRDVAHQSAPTELIELAGHLQAPQGRNMFTPVDEAEKLIWYTRDPNAIASALHLAEAAPFIFLLDGPSGLGDQRPRPVSIVPKIVNNHLAYAFTWFSLAMALIIIFGLFARERLRRGYEEI